MRSEDIKVRYMHLNNQTKSNRLYVSACMKLVWVLKGSAQWCIQNQLFYVEKGDMLLFNNQEPRILKRIDPSQELYCLILECPPQFLFSTPFMPLFLGPWHQKVRLLHHNEVLIKLFQQIKTESLSKENFSDILIASTFLQILAYIARAYELPAQNSCAAKELSSVMQYIDTHFTSPLSLNALARIGNMSRSRFSREFVLFNGMSPMQYILRKRIEYAISLLENSDYTILDIALRCGFNNSANFYTAFRKFTGGVPGDYRHNTHPVSSML